MIEPGMASRIVDYETGNMDEMEAIKLIADLIRTGIAWQLQGAYGRTASNMIQLGIISREGEVNYELLNMHEHKEF